MNILCKGNAADGTFMQLEDWHNTYPFIPFSVLKQYIESQKTSQRE